jgi:tyrosine-specific transport protein
MILNKTIGAVLLITGTCIGAGMLALPVSTAPAGFFSACVLIVFAWLLMTITGLYVAEVNVWLKGRASYISMAEQTLGKWAKPVTWALFLFLLYALMAAYISGGAALLTNVLHLSFGGDYSQWLGLLPWVVGFGLLIYCGTQAVDIINKFLVLGLVLAYVFLLIKLAPHSHWQAANLPMHPSYILAALPILLTSYGYHIIIPSVSQHLNHDVKKLRMVVVLGGLIALIVYLFWVYLIFNVLPAAGSHGLVAILNSGQPGSGITDALLAVTGNNAVASFAALFAFFALSSSFIGVALGLFHLLADGLDIQSSAIGKVCTALLTFLPPVIFAVYYPNGFIVALGYAGVIVALIHGILPAMMVWSGRYRKKLSHDSDYRVWGGKPLMVVVIVVSCLVIFSEVAGYLHWLPLL